MQADMEYIENLIIARLTGNISSEEDGFLDEMIEADEDVRQRWEDLQKVHSQLYNGYDKEKAWNNVLYGIAEKNQSKKKRRNLLVLPILLLIIASAGILYYSFDKTPTDTIVKATGVKINKGIIFSTEQGMVNFEKNQQGNFMAGDVQVVNDGGALQYQAEGTLAKTGTIEVPQGLDYQLTLSDSTKVWINAATKLEFPLAFTGNTREVKLTGEAYFEVAHNEKKPFIVHSGQMDVKVLGTSFNIKAYQNEPVQASLVTGRVEASLSGQQSSLILSPGKAARIKGEQLQESAFDANYTLAWIRGYYYFNSESLSQINYTVERWFGLSFDYADESIRNIDFSGALEKRQNLTDFLNRICVAANLSYKVAGEKILLSRK
jgi:ferric-dicitrate binding protein FerR (iron transport regulator)